MSEKNPTGEELKILIEAKFPDIDIRGYEYVESGWDNHIIITDSGIVFKIPRGSEQHESLRKEVELTRCLKGCPVNIPEFAYVSDSTDCYMAGYRYIAGLSLNSTRTLRSKIKKQLTDLLNFLYDKSREDCITDILGSASEDKWAEAYRQYRETIFSSLYDLLDDATLSILAGRFEQFDASLSTLAVSLIHGDLYRGNVLIDETGSTLNGVIDWGTAGLGDPAIDFAALCVDFTVGEVESVLSGYKGRVDRNFRRRMEFYWQLEPTYGILYFRERDRKKLEQLLKEFSKRLREGLY